MTYQRGQGLNHSVTDAGKLVEAIMRIQDGDDRQEAIQAFEDEMITRGGSEVRDGTANTTMLHDWEKVKQSPLFTRGMKKTDT
jgi:2-polyprenyl-6-methoxyphenol hydroxylase-like FAD-dependent oxidoreductase